MRSIVTIALVASALALAAAPAQATTVTAGLSGQCYDGPGHGGQDSLRATVDSSNTGAPLSVQVLTVTGAVAALAQFAAGTAANPPPADACANADTLDYLEADAAVDAMGVQVCYIGNEASAPVVVNPDGPAHNPCPTTPSGPGGPG